MIKKFIRDLSAGFAVLSGKNLLLQLVPVDKQKKSGFNKKRKLITDIKK